MNRDILRTEKIGKDLHMSGAFTEQKTVSAIFDDAPAISVAPESEDTTKPVGTTVVIISNGGKVNIRVGHGTGYSRIMSVAPGTTLEYVATAANGWNAVIVGAKVGWVSGKYSRII